jgi:hypothetical protein
MLLPIDPTRHWHRSLCFVFAGIALLGGVLVAVLTTPIVGIAGIVISALFLIASVRADGAYRLYHAYNVGTGIYARLMRAVAQLACFTIVASARLTGTSLVVALPGSDSMWTPKGSLPADAYVNPYAFSSVPGGRGWMRGYIRWARHTHNMWALTLLPFLVVLRSAQQSADHSIRGEIYSLY